MNKEDYELQPQKGEYNKDFPFSHFFPFGSKREREREKKKKKKEKEKRGSSFLAFFSLLKYNQFLILIYRKSIGNMIISHFQKVQNLQRRILNFLAYSNQLYAAALTFLQF